METLRLFIAIELPPEVKQALARLQTKLKTGRDTPVKWVATDAMHLTLQFLGDVDAGLTGKINAALEIAARGTSPFRLELTGLGVFPGTARVRVVWVGLGGQVDELLNLQKCIETALVHLGFTPESRPFTAHLTLGRVRDNATPSERQALGQLIEKTAFKDAPGFDVKNVRLVQSQLRPQGPVYTLLASVELM